MHEEGILEHAVAVVMIDDENCFGTLEFEGIRKAIQADVPGLAPWVAWEQAGPAEVEQDGVEPRVKNRGAEQGN
eukprot:8810486-Karenia_brevis.AAC.1